MNKVASTVFWRKKTKKNNGFEKLHIQMGQQMWWSISKEENRCHLVSQVSLKYYIRNQYGRDALDSNIMETFKMNFKFNISDKKKCIVSWLVQTPNIYNCTCM